jgi:hypothetical protein
LNRLALRRAAAKHHWLVEELVVVIVVVAHQDVVGQQRGGEIELTPAAGRSAFVVVVSVGGGARCHLVFR